MYMIQTPDPLSNIVKIENNQFAANSFCLFLSYLISLPVAICVKCGQYIVLSR